MASTEQEEYDFRREMCLRPSPTAVIAIHGGSIEPGTSELARAIAGDELSYYLFEGIKPRGNGILHIASTRFDDPLCLDVVERSDTVVAVHGSNRNDAVALVSGLAEDLVEKLIRALNTEGFTAGRDIGRCGGTDPRNICNRGSLGRGAQIEMSRGLRLTLFVGLARRRRCMVLPEFNRCVEAIRSVIRVTPEGPAVA